MIKPLVKLRVAVFFVCCLFFQWSVSQLVAQQTMVVDSRLMLLANPLVQNFDPETRRFRGTISEPVKDGKKGLENLKKEIEQLSDQLVSHLPERSVPPGQAGSRESRAQRRLRLRQGLTARLQMLKRREIEASSVPGRPGLTMVASIKPQTNAISDSIKWVIQKLQRKYGCPVVIDQASLMPLDVTLAKDPDRAVLNSNAQFLWWRRGIKQTDPNPFYWIDQARQFWLKEPAFMKTLCPYGAKDVTIEAARLMKRIGRIK